MMVKEAQKYLVKESVKSCNNMQTLPKVSLLWSVFSLSVLEQAVHLLNDLTYPSSANRQNIFLTLFSFAAFPIPPSTSYKERRNKVQLEF